MNVLKMRAKRFDSSALLFRILFPRFLPLHFNVANFSLASSTLAFNVEKKWKRLIIEKSAKIVA